VEDIRERKPLIFRVVLTAGQIWVLQFYALHHSLQHMLYLFFELDEWECYAQPISKPIPVNGLYMIPLSLVTLIFFSLHFSLIFKVSFTSVHPYEEERSIALIIKFLIIIGIKFCFLCAQKANSTLRSICLVFHVRKGQWHWENLSLLNHEWIELYIFQVQSSCYLMFGFHS
jgi:hypothetical protein